MIYPRLNTSQAELPFWVNLSKILGAIVSIIGFLVVLAWLLGINEWTTVLPQLPSMKFTTAVSFVFSGLIIVSVAFLTQSQSVQFVQILLPTSSFVIVLLMATISASLFLGIPTGIENLLNTGNATLAVNSSARPSNATIVNFFLIAIVAFMTMSSFSRISSAYYVIGITVSVIGTIAIVGFITHQPLLYYSIVGVSSAMAIHTSILFVMLGISLVFCGHALEITRNKIIGKAFQKSEGH